MSLLKKVKGVILGASLARSIIEIICAFMIIIAVSRPEVKRFGLVPLSDIITYPIRLDFLLPFLTSPSARLYRSVMLKPLMILMHGGLTLILHHMLPQSKLVLVTHILSKTKPVNTIL
jgi:hypothetical protein